MSGVEEIDNAQWVRDEYNTLWLRCKDEIGHEIALWLELLPAYMDRGHIKMCDGGGHLNIDHADSFPRYFFSFQEADKHARDFLKWRLWKHRATPLHLLHLDFAQIPLEAKANE